MSYQVKDGHLYVGDRPYQEWSTKERLAWQQYTATLIDYIKRVMEKLQILFVMWKQGKITQFPEPER